jgi:hypothetical protein
MDELALTDGWIRWGGCSNGSYIEAGSDRRINRENLKILLLCIKDKLNWITKQTSKEQIPY